jgi:tetratricopeptide (TPR) repeat protein
VLVILAGVDLTQDGAYVAVEVMRRGLYGALLLMTMAALLIPRVEQPRLEDRPGPLLLIGAAAALAVFLIHNSIDFAFFETGPMYLVAMLLGAVIGIRGPLESRRFAWLPAAVWLIIAAGVAVVVGLPVIGGELAAQRGDAELAGKRFGAAAAAYRQAFDDSLWLRNGDYLMRQGRAQAYGGASPQQIVATLEKAVSVHPREIKAWLMLGGTRVALGDVQGAENAYEEAMRLNRTDIRMRIEAADMLFRWRPATAARWYAEALALNDLLPADEPKRLSGPEVEKTRQKQARALSGNP